MFRRLFGRGQYAPRTEEEAQQEEQKIDQATEKARRGCFGRPQPVICPFARAGKRAAKSL